MRDNLFAEEERVHTGWSQWTKKIRECSYLPRMRKRLELSEKQKSGSFSIIVLRNTDCRVKPDI